MAFKTASGAQEGIIYIDMQVLCISVSILCAYMLFTRLCFVYIGCQHAVQFSLPQIYM